jgi:hypothetical protein
MSEVRREKTNEDLQQDLAGQESGAGPLPYLEMYEIPGYNNITAHAFSRYERDKVQQQAIEDAAKNSPLAYKQKVEDAPEEEKAELIEKAFSSNNPDLQRAVAWEISDAPENQMTELIKKGLKTGDEEVQLICTNFIAFFSMRARSEQWGREGSQPNERQNQKMLQLIEAVLATNNVMAQAKAAEYVSYIRDDKQEGWLRNKFLPIVEAGLDGDNPNIQEHCVKMIRACPAGRRSKLMEEFFEIGDAETKCVCVTYSNASFSSRTEMDEFKKKSMEFVGNNLGKITADIKWYAKMVSYASSDDSLHGKVIETIKGGLMSEDKSVQRASFEAIEYVRENEKAGLLALAKKEMGDVVVEPPLYREEISKEKFARKKFEKTGSGLTLIGGELKDKAVVREIDPKAFLAWQQLYENHELWKSNEFDYVPIEPILSFKLNKSGKVNAYTGVLDIDLYAWTEAGGDFSQELREDEKKILGVLEGEEFKHGHTHERNFCLRFFRNKDGSVDFSKKPRIYLIDFDQAVSPRQ